MQTDLQQLEKEEVFWRHLTDPVCQGRECSVVIFHKHLAHLEIEIPKHWGVDQTMSFKCYAEDSAAADQLFFLPEKWERLVWLCREPWQSMAASILETNSL